MFGEMSEKEGGYKQQDADECFQCILDTIAPYVMYEVYLNCRLMIHFNLVEFRRRKIQFGRSIVQN